MTGSDVEGDIAQLARHWSEGHLGSCEWTKVDANGRGEVEIRAKYAASVAETLILRIVVRHRERQILLTNIMMPPPLKRRGLGKALIASIRELSQTAGYALFATDLVQGFHDRLVARGAVVIVEDDIVQITSATDLSHRHG